MLQRNFGSDPEYFITDKKIVNTEYGDLVNIIPPASLITDLGVKFTMSKNNKRILISNLGYNWIEDGAALELNYKEPQNNPSDLNRLNISAKRALKTFLQEIDTSLTFTENVVGYFDIKKFWEGRDKSFLECVMFGCDPDIFPQLYMLMGFEENVCKIVDASKHVYRYAGGHIHTQNMSKYPNIYVENSEYASILFDFIVGTRNILFEREENILKQELARLKYYGRPGRIRIQNYSDTVNGLEYRPPSNQWINNIYNCNAILYAVDIASNIVEKGGVKKFFNSFQDRVDEVWSALTLHDKKLSENLLVDSLTWAVDNYYTDMEGVENVCRNIQ